MGNGSGLGWCKPESLHQECLESSGASRLDNAGDRDDADADNADADADDGDRDDADADGHDAGDGDNAREE